jgi:hypothetical protein
LQAFLHENLTPATPKPTSIACLESRGWFARADSTPFAIISFRLSTMSDLGHPPRIIEKYVETYFADSQQDHSASGFEFFEELFSFENKTSIRNFAHQASSLTRKLVQ